NFIAAQSEALRRIMFTICSSHVESSCVGVALVEARKPIRLFFSVFPDPPAAARIEHLTRPLRITHRFTGQPLRTTRFHCSLYGFADRDGARFDIVAKAKEAAAIITNPPFRVAFDCVKSFSGKP